LHLLDFLLDGSILFGKLLDLRLEVSMRRLERIRNL